MTTTIRSTGLIGLSIGFAFLLGWSMRGDHIYSGMFESTVNAMPPLKVVEKRS